MESRVRGEVANLGYAKNFDVADREAIIQGILSHLASFACKGDMVAVRLCPPGGSLRRLTGT